MPKVDVKAVFERRSKCIDCLPTYLPAYKDWHIHNKRLRTIFQNMEKKKNSSWLYLILFSSDDTQVTIFMNVP